MAAQRRSHAVWILTLALVAAGRWTASGEDKPAAYLASHVVLETAAGARLTRPGWKGSVPLSLGTSLRQGDLLRVPGQGKVLIACGGDLALQGVSGDKWQPVPCGKAPAVETPDGNYPAPRDIDAAAVPVLISPRMTLILGLRPRLRWQPTALGKSWTLRLLRDGLQIWEASYPTAEPVVYPEGAPPLERGPVYQFVVDEGGRSSREAEPQSSGFTVLPEKRKGRIAAALEKIQALSASPEALRYLRARLYLEERLLAEALEELLALPPEARTAPVLCDLAAVYRTTGLSRRARGVYEEVLRLAADDVEAAAQAREGLAATGDGVEAEQHLAAALQLYQKLGAAADEARVRQLLTKPGTGKKS